MPGSQADVQTSVQQVDLDVDSWLPAPGADSIITPNTNVAPKTNIFTNKPTDFSFIDKEDESDPDKSKQNDDKAQGDKTSQDDGDVSHGTSTTNIVDEITKDDEPGDDVDIDKNKGGRPKTEKSGLVEFLKKRIESKEMFAFNDYDESKQTLDDYLGSLSEKDIDELWQANLDNIKSEVASKTPQEFFESLPDELQYAAQYVANGGQDLKGLFKALAQVEEVRELDPAKEADQEQIVRNYFLAKGESSEFIDEQINEWKDLGNLAKKAQQFKPKLDQMQEQIVQAQLQEQENRRAQQEQAAEAYMKNVFEALRPAEINGLKLDKKTQALLYSGLVQPQYPSISGRPTNLLGHLLEKYQFVEPNYGLIAEALWLLSNPDEYREQLRKQGDNRRVEQTVKTLKIEQSRKNSSSYQEDDDQRPRKLVRPGNIFKR